jgi:hypothetical protein
LGTPGATRKPTFGRFRRRAASPSPWNRSAYHLFLLHPSRWQARRLLRRVLPEGRTLVAEEAAGNCQGVTVNGASRRRRCARRPAQRNHTLPTSIRTAAYKLKSITLVDWRRPHSVLLFHAAQVLRFVIAAEGTCRWTRCK